MAKKKSKTVKKKASKSRASKKKSTSSGARTKASAASSKKKTTKKKTTKKKVAAKKTTKKKTVKKKAATKKAGRTAKATASRPGGKNGATTKKSASKNTAAKSTASKAAAFKPASTQPGPLHDPAHNGRNGEAVEWTPAKLRKVKTGLTRKDYNYFLALLLEKRAEIMGDVAGLEAARRAQDGDISHVPLHMADVGSDNYEQEFTLGLMESERRLVGDIDEAISRIQDKTFGVCIESGQPIPRERLEIKPWARYTIDVARDRERHGLPV